MTNNTTITKEISKYSRTLRGVVFPTSDLVRTARIESDMLRLKNNPRDTNIVGTLENDIVWLEGLTVPEARISAGYVRNVVNMIRAFSYIVA